MTVRKADPAARRRAVWIVVAGACAGALLVFAFETYRAPLGEWMLADPEPRVRLVFLLMALLALAPMAALAAWLWSLGGRIVAAREFPPPGLRVTRDTVLLTGDKAVFRGDLLKALALACGAAGAVLGLLLFRLASVLFP